jgi:hypothetical protein
MKSSNNYNLAVTALKQWSLGGNEAICMHESDSDLRRALLLA